MWLSLATNHEEFLVLFPRHTQYALEVASISCQRRRHYCKIGVALDCGLSLRAEPSCRNTSQCIMTRKMVLHAAALQGPPSTVCIKMIGMFWKLIIFTSMMNRLINCSRTERVTLQVYDTCPQIFDVHVCTLRHTVHSEALFQFLPYSDQQIRCDGLHSSGNSVLQ